MRHRNLFLLVILAVLMYGCGGNKILKEPQSLEIQGPLVVGSDSRLAVALDWIIVRDGPGTWSKNAHWDEYLLRAHNLLAEEITIQSIVVYDSSETRIDSDSNRKQLIDKSNAASKRYQDEGFTVKEGLGGGQLAVIGGATAAVGAGVVASSSAYFGSAMAAGAVSVAAAPVILASGVLRGVNNSKVSKEIKNRSSDLPLVLMADSEVALDVFFPMSPSPVRIEVFYMHAGADFVLTLDTVDTLRGLHLADPERDDATD